MPKLGNDDFCWLPSADYGVFGDAYPNVYGWSGPHAVTASTDNANAPNAFDGKLMTTGDWSPTETYSNSTGSPSTTGTWIQIDWSATDALISNCTIIAMVVPDTAGEPLAISADLSTDGGGVTTVTSTRTKRVQGTSTYTQDTTNFPEGASGTGAYWYVAFFYLDAAYSFDKIKITITNAKHSFTTTSTTTCRPREIFFIRNTDRYALWNPMDGYRASIIALTTTNVQPDIFLSTSASGTEPYDAYLPRTISSISTTLEAVTALFRYVPSGWGSGYSSTTGLPSGYPYIAKFGFTENKARRISKILLWDHYRDHASSASFTLQPVGTLTTSAWSNISSIKVYGIKDGYTIPAIVEFYPPDEDFTLLTQVNLVDNPSSTGGIAYPDTTGSPVYIHEIPVPPDDYLFLIVEATTLFPQATAGTTTPLVIAMLLVQDINNLDADIVPDQFTFTDVTGATTSTVYTSNVVTLSGMTPTTDCPIVIAADSTSGTGYYRINGGSWTQALGTVQDGDDVEVKITSSADSLTEVYITLSIGGVIDTYSVTTELDSTPDAFNFVDLSSQAVSSVVTSAAVQITGFSSGLTTIAVTGTTNCTSPEIAIGPTSSPTEFVPTPLNIPEGWYVKARMTTSANYNTTCTLTVTAGGVSDTWYVDTVTAGPDTTPDTFTFVDEINANTSTEYASNSIVVSGINTSTPITVTGGYYRINAGSWTNTAGNVIDGDAVQVKGTSSSSYNTAVDVILTIGGVSDTFTITTMQDSTVDAFVIPAITDATVSTLVYSDTVTLTGFTTAVTVTVNNGAEWRYKNVGGSWSGWISSAHNVNENVEVEFRVTSSGINNTTIIVTVTAGVTVSYWHVTTVAIDAIPEPFNFTDLTNQMTSSTITSNAITVSGLSGSIPVSIIACTSSSCEYQISGGSWLTAGGTVSNGDTVKVRLVSDISNGVTDYMTLDLNGVSDTWYVTTGEEITLIGIQDTCEQVAYMLPIIQGINQSIRENIDYVLTPNSHDGYYYNMNLGYYTSTPCIEPDGYAVTPIVSVVEVDLSTIAELTTTHTGLNWDGTTTTHYLTMGIGVSTAEFDIPITPRFSSFSIFVSPSVDVTLRLINQLGTVKKRSTATINYPIYDSSGNLALQRYGIHAGSVVDADIVRVVFSRDNTAGSLEVDVSGAIFEIQGSRNFIGNPAGCNTANSYSSIPTFTNCELKLISNNTGFIENYCREIPNIIHGSSSKSQFVPALKGGANVTDGITEVTVDYPDLTVNSVDYTLSSVVSLPSTSSYNSKVYDLVGNIAYFTVSEV